MVSDWHEQVMTKRSRDHCRERSKTPSKELTMQQSGRCYIFCNVVIPTDCCSTIPLMSQAGTRSKQQYRGWQVVATNNLLFVQYRDHVWRTVRSAVVSPLFCSVHLPTLVQICIMSHRELNHICHFKGLPKTGTWKWESLFVISFLSLLCFSLLLFLPLLFSTPCLLLVELPFLSSPSPPPSHHLSPHHSFTSVPFSSHPFSSSSPSPLPHPL